MIQHKNELAPSNELQLEVMLKLQPTNRIHYTKGLENNDKHILIAHIPSLAMILIKDKYEFINEYF